MASEVISVIVSATVAACLIVCVFAEPPVQIDERHLQPQHQDDNAGNGWQDSVPGLPGRDYPNLTSIPETSFSCAGKTPGGYYADVETRCQVFHVCSTNGAKSSFLCPSGSVFNQRHFVCDWWYDFICEQAPELYALNRGLDDRLETSSTTPAIDPSLQFNSIAGPGGDLSLASSGYPNNIRDDANSIYEDYASIKTADTEPAKEKFPSSTTSSPPSSQQQQFGDSSRSTTSGIPVDNYSETRRQERLNSQQHQTRSRNQEEQRRALTYRRRPIHGLDNVPRGFSKDHAEEQAQAKGNDQGAGSFVNNGLVDENEKNKDFPLPRENNNYVDSERYYKIVHVDNRGDFNRNKNNNNNFNGNDNNFNNNNNNNNKNNRFDNYYQSTESSPLLQENSNRVNKNYKYNNNNDQNNYYNGNNDAQSNNYYNQNNYVNDQNGNSNYYNRNNVNSNDYYNPSNNNVNYENYNQKAENIETSTVNTYSTNFDLLKDHTAQTTPEPSTTRHRSINSSPTEDDVDRERQREVDSADLKRQRPQPRHQQSYENPSPTFLIREEFTPSTWRDDLSTSSTASQSPPYPPDRSYISPDTSSLSKPVEVTTPVSDSKPKPQERPKFLGRRPAGGLPSGAGNGLPGANKPLVGSDAITNTPGDESGDRVTNAWDQQSSTYLPPQAYNEFGNNGRYDNWNNNNGQTWNNGANSDGRY